LLITDILMPDMEGNELAIKVKTLKPDLKIIGMTGGGRLGTADRVKRLCISTLFEEILNKPFLEEDLFAQITLALS